MKRSWFTPKSPEKRLSEHQEKHPEKYEKPHEIQTPPIVRRGYEKTTKKPNLTKDELVHYSRRAGLKNLDPAQMGTGGTRMKQQPPEHKSTFYYTPESKPEQEVTQGAKSRYTIKVGPEHKIYDLSHDPDKMYQAVQSSNQGAFNEDILHGMLKDKGFHGVKWKMRDGTHVVQMYHPMPVHQEHNLQEMEKAEKYTSDQIWEHRKNVSTKDRPATDGVEHSHMKRQVKKYDQYEKKSIPVHKLTAGGKPFNKPFNSQEDENRAKTYSEKSSKPPEIIAHPNGPGKYEVVDGRHRTRAAHLRGDTHIEAYVPVKKSEHLEKSGPITPSKHIHYKRLEQIKQDHYQGAGGKEYGEEETNQAIMDRKVADADRQVKEADRMQRRDPSKLQKGAMKRLAPFNPAKDVTEKTRDKMANWQSGNGTVEDRDILGQTRMDPNARKRALHTLSAKTPTRRSTEGGREFLLHRGMGRHEYDQTRKFTPEGKRIIQPSLTYGHTSWTPNLAIANNFQYSPSDSEGNALEKPGGVASAWIHEKHIRMVPKQYGTYGSEVKNAPFMGENQYAHEHEVLVAPHHGSELVHGDEVKKLLPYGKDLENTTPANIDQQVNFRGDKAGSPNSANYTKDYAFDRGRLPKKLTASEPMHKSENVDEDTNSLMNRQEDKYFLPTAKLAEFCRALQDQLKDGDIDTSARYNQNRTIYLDNRDLDSFKDNMEKVKPRFKVRIRQYKPNGEEWEDIAYVELKVKANDGMTQKFRVRIPATEMARIAQGGEINLTDELPGLNRDITKDVLWKRVASINGVIMKCGFRKQITVEYNRRAFSGKDLRITVDDSLRFCECLPIEKDVLDSITNSDHWKRASKSEKKLLWNDVVIVEVKHEIGTPEWVRKLLKENKAEEVSFSKYCGAIISHVLHGQKHEGMMSRNKAYNADQVLGYVLGQDSVQTLGKTEKLETVDLDVPICDNQAMIDALTKGFLRDAMVSTSLAALMGAGGQAHGDTFGDNMTRAISSVESNSGQNTAHKPVKKGLNAGQSAVGKYGLMPKSVKDIAKLDHSIGQKHPSLQTVPDNQVAGYIQKHPGLEDQLAQSHLKRLRGHFGDDPDKISFAWLNGISGTNKALKEGKDLGSHWHVKKVREALKGLNKPQKSQSLVDNGVPGK